mmetsp:Transcript_9645/g.40394  ORF Transcript_9645/g.40394 Transcript_9645/m.40394 type:complete len:273 (+) Transcript_9645:258-1076(+)
MSNESACSQNAQNSALDAYSDFSAPRRSHTSLSSSNAPDANSTDTIVSGSDESLLVKSTQSGAKTRAASSFVSASQNGKYGFMSNTGVPSTKSAPPTSKKPFSWSTCLISTRLKPIGKGLCGVRVANTPRRSPFRRGTRTFARDVVDLCDLRESPSSAGVHPSRRVEVSPAPTATCRSVFSWKTYMIQTWLNCSRPSKAAGGTWRRSVRRPRARGTSCGCRGVPLRRLKQERNLPMGRSGYSSTSFASSARSGFAGTDARLSAGLNSPPWPP